MLLQKVKGWLQVQFSFIAVKCCIICRDVVEVRSFICSVKVYIISQMTIFVRPLLHGKIVLKFIYVKDSYQLCRHRARLYIASIGLGYG